MVFANIHQFEMLILSFTSFQRMKNQSVKRNSNLLFKRWKQVIVFERSTFSSSKVTCSTKVSMIRLHEKSSISISNHSSLKPLNSMRLKTMRVERLFDLTTHLTGRKKLNYSKVKQVLKDHDLKTDWNELTLFETQSNSF